LATEFGSIANVFGLDRLRALQAVAAYGSIAAAADAMHMTPSGVSQQLAKLEQEAGQDLLAKDGRGVRLTAAGRLLADHAGRILEQVSAAKADLDALRTEIAGTLRVGAVPTAVDGLFPQAMNLLSGRYPGLRVMLSAGEAEDTIPAVLRGDLDIAVFDSWEYLPTRMPRSVTRIELLEDVADLALPKTHRLARRKVVELREVTGIDWVAWTEHSTCYEWLIQTLRSQGLDPVISCAVGSFATQLSLVAAGLVAGLIPRLGRERVPDNVVLIPVRPALKREISALWRTDAERAAFRALVGSVRAAAAP
jgi:DNA-binding transcriptional LysR family regulator